MAGNVGFVKGILKSSGMAIRPDELDMILKNGDLPLENVSSYGYKVCATRHGCSGATNCDRAYSDYHR